MADEELKSGCHIHARSLRMSGVSPEMSGWNDLTHDDEAVLNGAPKIMSGPPVRMGHPSVLGGKRKGFAGSHPPSNHFD